MMSKVSIFPRFAAGHRSAVLSIARPIADWNYQDELERHSDTCSPDFIVKVAGEAARGVRRVLIETEGFADEAYRVRKSPVHVDGEGYGRAGRAARPSIFDRQGAQCR
jgi:hypothetical protein